MVTFCALSSTACAMLWQCTELLTKGWHSVLECIYFITLKVGGQSSAPQVHMAVIGKVVKGSENLTRRSGDISRGPATSAAASASTAAACARRRRSPAAAHSSAPHTTCQWQHRLRCSYHGLNGSYIDIRATRKTRPNSFLGVYQPFVHGDT